jgi:hypothetical protein
MFVLELAFDDDDSGAMLVFDSDEAGVREIVAADPYYTTPGVTVVGLRDWRPVVGAPTDGR